MKDNGQKIFGDVKATNLNSLVPSAFDRISSITYVPSGNGAGEIQTITYALGATTIVTLTLTYDSSNRITSVIPS